jgi:hypothetical protein
MVCAARGVEVNIVVCSGNYVISAYRCRMCDRYTMLSGTAFAKATNQHQSRLVDS